MLNIFDNIHSQGINTLWAHNGGISVSGELSSSKKHFLRINSIYYMTLRYKKTNVTFRDSYLLLNPSLMTLGSNFLV